MNNSKRVAFYIRSAHSQSSIDMHVQRLTQACADQGNCLVQIYIDHGFSGIRLDRPSLQRMLEDAENHQFDEVMVPRFSQLSRRTIDLLTIIKKLQNANINVISPENNFDLNSPFSKFSIQMFSAFTEFQQQLESRGEEC